VIDAAQDDPAGYIALRCAMIEFAFREARGTDIGGGATLGKRVSARRWIDSPLFAWWAQGLPIDVERARARIRDEVGQARWDAEDARYERDQRRNRHVYVKRAQVDEERERIGSLLAEIRSRLIAGNTTASAATETQTLSSVAVG
jgi:hypothetical protein